MKGKWFTNCTIPYIYNVLILIIYNMVNIWSISRLEVRYYCYPIECTTLPFLTTCLYRLWTLNHRSNGIYWLWTHAYNMCSNSRGCIVLSVTNKVSYHKWGLSVVLCYNMYSFPGRLPYSNTSSQTLCLPYLHSL